MRFQTNMKKVIAKFPAATPSFHQYLKDKAVQFQKDHLVDFSTSGPVQRKAIILISGFIVTYCVLMFAPLTPALGILMSLVLSLFISAIGFNVMHDGAHGSFAQSTWLNGLASGTLNVLGGSSFLWKQKHNIIHHSFTNVDGMDDDIEFKPFLRFAPTQQKRWFHKYQHIYFWFLYGLFYIYWVLVSDFKKYFKKSIGPFPLKKMSTADHLEFWGSKLLHYTLFMALPIYLHGFSAWLVCYLVMTVSAGLVLSIVFQMAHAVEITHFPTAGPDKKFDDEWAVHQVRTTADFATSKRWVWWFTGGLNYQVEHHLFPKISHAHYPEIRTFVKEACNEWGIPYLEEPSLRKSIISHIRFMKAMGQAA